MTDEEATQISGWHYESPYDFYDATSDADDLQEILDPKEGCLIRESGQDGRCRARNEA